MSRRHADNWNHRGHYLVDPYPWPWSPNGHGHGQVMNDLLPPPWHADNWSHCGHYLVDPYTWPWSPNGHGHEWPTATPFCAMSIGPPILRYSYFKIWPWKSMVKVMCVVKGQDHVWPSKFKGQGHGQGQTWWSHLRPWSSMDMFAFRFVAIGPFLAEIKQIYIWPWKFKGKVMAKVKPDGHI